MSILAFQNLTGRCRRCSSVCLSSDFNSSVKSTFEQGGARIFKGRRRVLGGHRELSRGTRGGGKKIRQAKHAAAAASVVLPFDDGMGSIDDRKTSITQGNQADDVVDDTPGVVRGTYFFSSIWIA